MLFNVVLRVFSDTAIVECAYYDSYEIFYVPSLREKKCVISLTMYEVQTLDVKLRLWTGMANLKLLFFPVRPDPVILPT